MGISYLSVLSFSVCILSIFCCLFTIGSTGTVLAVSFVLSYITIPLCVILAIFAKRHRKINNLFGQKLEIYTLMISIFTISYIIDSFCLSGWFFVLTILPCFIYAKSFNNIVYGQEETYCSSQKHWFMRPVAWILTIIMMLALQFIAELLCLAGEYIVLWLSGLSTVVVILLTMAFGGLFLGIITYSVTLLPAIVVTLSDKVYPSNHAFRYYFVGIYEIIGCAILIYAGIIGSVTGGTMFWFYARYVWLIVVSIAMMLMGRGAANDRHNT